MLCYVDSGQIRKEKRGFFALFGLRKCGVGSYICERVNALNEKFRYLSLFVYFNKKLDKSPIFVAILRDLWYDITMYLLIFVYYVDFGRLFTSIKKLYLSIFE